MEDDPAADLKALTADVVSAYVSSNMLGSEELSKLISDTYQALSTAGAPAPVRVEAPKPDKAAVRKSVQPDYLTSFLDGRQYKSLKRHLNTQGLTPDEYRSRFGLAKDYPMVAPNYSAQRRQLAKTLGLGRKAVKPPPPPSEPTPPEPKRARAPASAEKPARGRKPKAIKPADETFT